MEKFRFYTDGVKTIKVKEGDTPPEGFYAGRTFNHNAWNKGLTKNTDERVRKNTESMRNTRLSNGTYESSWNKGLTKETSTLLQETAVKISLKAMGREAWNKGVPCTEEAKRKISEANKGNVAWNKGLTKETDVRLMATSKKLTGRKSPITNWEELKKKEHATKLARGTWRGMGAENAYYDRLVLEYGADDVVRQYSSEKYPFKCDFYIKSKDLYIEYNGSWTHNTHPFDSNNCEDIEMLSKWKEKAVTSSYYKGAVYIWTDLDVRKLETFRKNKLNFQIIYPASGMVVDK